MDINVRLAMAFNKYKNILLILFACYSLVSCHGTSGKQSAQVKSTDIHKQKKIDAPKDTGIEGCLSYPVSNEFRAFLSSFVCDKLPYNSQTVNLPINEKLIDTVFLYKKMIGKTFLTIEPNNVGLFDLLDTIKNDQFGPQPASFGYVLYENKNFALITFGAVSSAEVICSFTLRGDFISGFVSSHDWPGNKTHSDHYRTTKIDADLTVKVEQNEIEYYDGEVDPDNKEFAATLKIDSFGHIKKVR